LGEHVKNLRTLCFAPPHPLSNPKKKKEKLAWKVNSGQSSLHTKHNLKKNPPLPLTHKKNKEGP
jgi:hypothetical protein